MNVHEAIDQLRRIQTQLEEKFGDVDESSDEHDALQNLEYTIEALRGVN